MNVPVTPGIKSRDVVCTIAARRLKVGLRGQPPIIDGELQNKVIVDDSFWTLEDGKEVCLLLQKENQMEWWKCVIKGDAEIDTTKVQPENSSLEDLDAETRQTVEKMMVRPGIGTLESHRVVSVPLYADGENVHSPLQFDQRQKAAGKPTSEEMKKQDVLKKFMAQVRCRRLEKSTRPYFGLNRQARPLTLSSHPLLPLPPWTASGDGFQQREDELIEWMRTGFSQFVFSR